MKTLIARSVALLVLAAMGFTSCSVEYRERHRHHDEHHETRVHERVVVTN